MMVSLFSLCGYVYLFAQSFNRGNNVSFHHFIVNRELCSCHHPEKIVALLDAVHYRGYIVSYCAHITTFFLPKQFYLSGSIIG